MLKILPHLLGVIRVIGVLYGDYALYKMDNDSRCTVRCADNKFSCASISQYKQLIRKTTFF